MEQSTEPSDDVPLPSTTGKQHYFPNVQDNEWNDWRWQFRNRITSLEELAPFFPLSREDWDKRGQVLKDFRMGITPYYLALIDAADPQDPILKQVVPLNDEYTYRAVGDEDPLGEENFSPVPGITHRYPDRVLFVVSNSCAIYCRYCTRKRIMYESASTDLQIDRMVDYIARTETVRDVIVSGGDPLTFATPVLERILAKLRAIPHVEIIRIGSRVPVALPQRIDDELCTILQKYHPLWINVHFNHPRECTPQAARACDKLLRAGIPLNNQSVLLKGVNDDVVTMKALIHGLMKMRVRPYYLYQCDPVRGAEHFRTEISRGLEIMEGLRGHTSGLAIPTYVIDAPGGGGKIPIAPQYLLHYDPRQGRAILRNFQGKIYEYWEPRLDAVPAATIHQGPVRVTGNGHAPAHGNGHAGTHGHGAHGNGAHGNAANGNGAQGNGGQGNGANANPQDHGKGLEVEAPVVGKSRWAHSNGRPHKNGAAKKD